MGGIALGKQTSLETYFPNFHIENWEEISTENRGRFGEFTILRNAITKEQIDKYQLMFLSDREQKDYEQSFMNRLREEYLVNGFHYEALKNKGICSNVRGAIVYVQHIPIRLTDITDIPLPDSLYMVKCSLLGFKKLFEKLGYFSAIEEHIGIDREGHVRVWLNADFSRNHPFGYDETSNNFKNEKVMVAEIIKLIEKNTSFESRESHANELMSFSNFIEKNHNGNPNFYEAIDLIESYALRNNIIISKHCTSVVEIFQEDYGEDFNLTNDDNFEDHLNLNDDEIYADREENKSSEINPVEIRSEKSQEAFHYPNNMKSSRSFKENNSVSQNHHKEAYKEYEPISTYKPNERIARLSSTENNIMPSYNNQYRQSQQSQQSQSSLHSNHSNHSNQSFHSHPSQSEIRQRNSHHQQQIYNHPRTNSSMHESARNLERSNCSSETISKPQSRAFIHGEIEQELNGSQRSNTVGSNSNLRSSSSLPKVTFNYLNKEDIKPELNTLQTKTLFHEEQNNINFYPTQPYKPSNNYKRSNSSNSEQNHINFIQNEFITNTNTYSYPENYLSNHQIHKISTNPNEALYNYYNQEIIIEDDDEDMDPEIIGDLLKEFPALELSG